MTPRTPHAVENLAKAVEAQMETAAGHLDRGLQVVEEMRAALVGLNGASGKLQGQQRIIEQAVSELVAEAEQVARKLRGQSPGPKIHEAVDEQKAEAVREARAVS